MSKKPNAADTVSADLQTAAADAARGGEAIQTAPAAASAAPKAPPPLAPARLQDIEFVRRDRRAVIEAGQPFEVTLSPDFWAHVGTKLRPYERIEVLAEDGAWVGEIMVLSSGRGYARVAPLWRVDLKAAVSEAEASSRAQVLDVDFAGPIAKHRVIRRSDRMVLREGFDTRAEAEAYARETLKAA